MADGLVIDGERRCTMLEGSVLGDVYRVELLVQRHGFDMWLRGTFRTAPATATSVELTPDPILRWPNKANPG